MALLHITEYQCLIKGQQNTLYKIHFGKIRRATVLDTLQ